MCFAREYEMAFCAELPESTSAMCEVEPMSKGRYLLYSRLLIEDPSFALDALEVEGSSFVSSVCLV